MEDDHEDGGDDALNINPEDLSPVPSVVQVVYVGSYDWHEHKRYLYQSIPVEFFVILLFELENTAESFIVEQS